MKQYPHVNSSQMYANSTFGMIEKLITKCFLQKSLWANR